MEGIIHLLIFAILVTIFAVIVIVAVEAILSALGWPINSRLIRLLVGLIALLIILDRAWPLIGVYA